MPVGFIMMRGNAALREETLEHLNTLVGLDTFAEKAGGMVEDVVSTMGWPDFVVTVYSPNIELMKNVIVMLRSIIEELVGDKRLETSTIVGVSSLEIEEKKKRLSKGNIVVKNEYLEKRSKGPDNLPVQKFMDKKIKKSIDEFLSKE